MSPKITLTERRRIVGLWARYLRTDNLSGRDFLRVRLQEINATLGTNYAERHLDNWVAGRKPTPQRVRDLLRKHYLIKVLGEAVGGEIAEVLFGPV